MKPALLSLSLGILIAGCSVPPATVSQGARVSSCTCTGTGIDSMPITVDCGQDACGPDDNTYACSASGWSFLSSGCGGPDLGGPQPDMTGAPCSCSGTGLGGQPITVACGQTACGSDDNTYSCGSSGFSFVSAGCAPPPDMAGAGADLATCSCNGTGPGGKPITASCGQEACGVDDNTYTCTASGFTFTASGCNIVAPPDMATACTCNGFGLGGAPLTVNCGQTACGEDDNTYSCTSSGFTFTAAGCHTVVPDMSGPTCTCNGTGPGNVPITASCGQEACGVDDNTYTCTVNGFVYSSSGCSITDMATQSTCTCNGTGIHGEPITVSCGRTACGEDDNTYTCGTGGFSFTNVGCAAGPADLAGVVDMAGTPCTCNGTGLGGAPITASCGQTACGADDNTYSCSSSGWSFAGVGCT